MSDQLIRALAELPSANPDATRAERTRARCRARLARQSQRTSAPSAPRRRIARAWQPAIAILGVVYLTTGVVQALEFYGSCHALLPECPPVLEFHHDELRLVLNVLGRVNVAVAATE